MTNKILKEDEWGASLNTTKNKRPILLTIDYNRFKIKELYQKSKKQLSLHT